MITNHRPNGEHTNAAGSPAGGRPASGGRTRVYREQRPAGAGNAGYLRRGAAPRPGSPHGHPASPSHSHTHAARSPHQNSGPRRAGGRGKGFRAGPNGPAKGGLLHRSGIKRPEDTFMLGGNPEAVRFVPLGGFEEVGRNMMFFEYKDEIVIIDAGLGFGDEDTPGVDFVLPNTEYLQHKKQNIRALILTHGHLDHIGAIPFIIEKIGNPLIYATSLTRALVERRQEEFPNLPKLKCLTIKNGDRVKIGQYFEAEFFGVAHNIPDTTGILLKTPVGNMVHFADFKIDYDAEEQPQGLDEFVRIGEKGIHTLMIDSTSATKPGHSVSERIVEKNLTELFQKAEGRVILATFSSLLTRIAEIAKIANVMGKKIFLNGYSMKTNVQIAQQLGFISAPDGLIQPLEEINKYRDDKILIITAGAQGEANSGFMKIVNGEHRFVTIKRGDTVVFSSSVIPGNERSIQALQDNLCRQGAIVYNSGIMDIHSSGHAPKDDLQMVMELMKPKFLMPVHGYYFQRAANIQSGYEAGIPKERGVLPDNGIVTEMTPDAVTITRETVPSYYVMVDGLGVGDVEEVVLRDRKALAQEGMLVIIATMSREDSRLLRSPDIISRGFIYLKEHHEIMDEMRKRIKTVVERLPKNRELEADYVKNAIRDQVGNYIFNKTKRRPMIIPVIIEV